MLLVVVMIMIGRKRGRALILALVVVLGGVEVVKQEVRMGRKEWKRREEKEGPEKLLLWVTEE